MSDPLADLDFTPRDYPCECPGCWSHGGTCVRPATEKTALHSIHECDRPDLDPNGDAIRLLCSECTSWHAATAERLAKQARAVYAQTGGILACRGCQRPLTLAAGFFTTEHFDGSLG